MLASDLFFHKPSIRDFLLHFLFAKKMHQNNQSICWIQIQNQWETPLLYELEFFFSSNMHSLLMQPLHLCTDVTYSTKHLLLQKAIPFRRVNQKGLLLEVQEFEDPARICSVSLTSQIPNVHLPNVKLVPKTLCSPSYTALFFHPWTAYLTGNRDHCCGVLDSEDRVLSLLACIHYKRSPDLQENLQESIHVKD